MFKAMSKTTFDTAVSIRNLSTEVPQKHIFLFRSHYLQIDVWPKPAPRAPASPPSRRSETSTKPWCSSTVHTCELW